MSVTIRQIQAEDFADFRECLQAVARERRYLAQVEAPPADQVKQFIDESVRQDVAQYVALAQGRIVGWCDVFPQWAYALQHVGTLGMGITEAYRGQGIGRRLLQQTLAHALKNGLYRVVLEARADNLRAIRLYESLGFQHEGSAPCALRFDGVFHAAVKMALLQGPARAAAEEAARPG